MNLNLRDKITAIRSFQPLLMSFLVYSLVVSILIYGYKTDLKEHPIAGSSYPLPLTSQEHDYSLISSWHLFGLNSDALLAKVKDSKIKLVGIIYRSQNTNGSNAVILVNDKEYVLRNGDKIGNEYTIHKIEPSRVVVASRNGLEEFSLFAN